MDIDTGKEIRQFEGGRGSGLFTVAFSPDGRAALSGQGNTAVVLWNIETGEVLRRFEGHTARVWSVVFSPDGRLALSAANDGTVRFWHLSLEALFDWIDENLHVREFTCKEREEYRIEPLCVGSGRFLETDA